MHTGDLSKASPASTRRPAVSPVERRVPARSGTVPRPGAVKRPASTPAPESLGYLSSDLAPWDRMSR